MIFKYTIVGCLIGSLIGAISGFGLLNTIKKSQRNDLLIPLIVSCVFVGLISGSKIGYNIGSEFKKEKVLGIDRHETNYYKQGRYWIAITKWTDPRTQTQYVLATGKSNSGELITNLNEENLFRHSITSGSQDNVSKYHLNSKSELFKALKKQL